MKEILSFQKLKISFSEILLLKKPSHASLVILFYLHNKEEVICKNKENHWLRSFIKRQTSGISSDNEWQRVTKSDTKWQRVATNNNEWQRVVQRVTKRWQRMAMSERVTAVVQRMKTAQYTSKNGWLPSFQWQKEIHYYFKGWMAAIRVVK